MEENRKCERERERERGREGERDRDRERKRGERGRDRERDRERKRNTYRPDTFLTIQKSQARKITHATKTTTKFSELVKTLQKRYVKRAAP